MEVLFMTKRIGILTSGGDCPGLNAAIRGVALASYGLMDCEIVGIKNGFFGLIHGDMIELKPSDFSELLNRGGTILGSFRTPFKKMRKIDSDGIDKVKAMVNNYHKAKLDCILCLGGNGTHKNANLLREEGLNVIGLPKTIDNDIWGTETSFGYASAVNIATDVIDRIHTTAASHDRVMIVELMGHKAGWLPLKSGIAGGVEIILIPEIPYSVNEVIRVIKERKKNGKNFSIIVVAEGAKTVEEMTMSKSEYKEYLELLNHQPVSYRLARFIEYNLGAETRVTVPGYQQRGGSPIAEDRVLATRIGAYAAKLIKEKDYGVAVSVVGGQLKDTPLEIVANKLKIVTEDDTLVKTARLIGISFGEPKK
jgi:6-phosphofructokinase 1